MARIRTIDGRLEIRIRHYAMRFLCLVLFIVSIVGFNNEKQPDGRMIGIGFLVATVLLLLATRSVTIELDRASDKFAIRYGGIVFGVPKKVIERPLHDLRFATTQTSLGSGLTRTSRGPSSRVVFVLASEEKIPLTRFFSGGDMGLHHQIEHSVNDFLKQHK
jgi:hypothetical protein